MAVRRYPRRATERRVTKASMAFLSPLDASARGGVGDRRTEERDGDDDVEEVDHFVLPVEGRGLAPAPKARRPSRFSFSAISRIA
jgi:hypothetical protein